MEIKSIPYDTKISFEQEGKLMLDDKQGIVHHESILQDYMVNKEIYSISFIVYEMQSKE